MPTTQSRDGTTIAYDRHGDGPPVVLVGGAFQHRALDPRTQQLAALLAERFTVLHYDRRGRGESGDTAPYAPEREVEDLAAVIATAGGQPVRVFGNSSGAAIALDGAKAGLPIARLALFEPPFIVDGSRPPHPPEYADRLAQLAAEGRRGEAIEYFLTTGVGVPAEMVAGMRQAPVWPAFEAVAHTLAYDAAFLRGLGSGDPAALRRWADVDVPALVLDGDASPDWFRGAAQATADALPDARRESLAGQTHEVDPAVLAPPLAAFFAD